MDSETVEADTDGSICSIHVRNFFCHDNLEINLNKNVNFIVGRNGSGKSAILTALVVGLGGRASATNRGNNLHSFIKKGANSASVEIKIRNSTEQAYKHDVYGDFITIERHINASGGSSYKVKNAQGKVVSTKFDEVNNIITAHDIQVDNPISVLNQDEARSFHSADARKKFTLFRKATNLDRTEANYVTAMDSCKLAKKIWDKKSEALEDVRKERDKLKAAHARLQSRGEIVAQEKALVNEYYWSEIQEKEKDAERLQALADKQQAKIHKLEEKLARIAGDCGSNNGVIDALKAEIMQHDAQCSQLEQQLSELEGQLRAAQTALRRLTADGDKQNDLIRRKRRQVKELEQGINSINAGGSSSQRESLAAAAGAARAALDGVRARYSTAQHEFAQAQANTAHAAQARDKAQQPRQHVKNKLVKLRQELRELESSRGNDSLGVYGGKMAALCQAVKQAVARGQFTQAPRGPVGAHLKVREKKWGGALEHVLGGSLKSFLVNDDKDRILLFKLMDQVYGRESKPSVTCSKFLPRQHDVSQHVVRARPYVSALDSLVVDDPVVANFLIDSVGVERILMVPEHADAQRLSDRVENVPANCSRIVTLDSTEYFPAPRYRSYGGSNPRARFLAVSSGERHRQLKDDIKEAEAELKMLDAEEKQLSMDLNEARELEHQASRALKELLGLQHIKEKEARDAEAALDTQQAPHHAMLEEELNVCKKELARLTVQAEQRAQQEREQRQAADALEQQLTELKKELGAQRREHRNKQEEIEQEEQKQQQGAMERQNLQQRLKEDGVKMKEIENALAERRAHIEELTAGAEKLCPRASLGGNIRDKDTVQKEIEKARSKLKSIRTDGRSKVEVAEELLRVETKYRDTEDRLQRIQNLVEKCTGSTERHRYMGYKLQKRIAGRVAHGFNAMLTVNGYSGNMNIDFSNCVLEITCTGRESTRHASTTASLSGGERSYSTVAFIMALWACVELPFYFMDEFDVFMDNMNRHKVMNLLLNHALKNPSRQFVFLTPQDASSVKAGPSISIHVMADPRP